MGEKIKWITEAFSVEPGTFIVGQQNIHSINLEEVIYDGDPFQFYIARDIHGNKVVQYKANTVNIGYFDMTDPF